MANEELHAKLIVPDTGPLITLAAADSLDYLLYPAVPVYVPDAVLYEATVKSDALGAQSIAGWVQRHSQQVYPLATHVEAVLKMFDPEFNCRAIAARRKQSTNPWFRRGTLFREALGVLRTATAPMTVTELAHAVLAANNLTDTATRKQRLGIESGIRAALENHVGKTVQRAGEGVPKRWKLAQ